MGTREKEFIVKPFGSVLVENGTISNQAYYDSAALLPPLVISSFAAPQPSHNLVQHHHYLAQKYAIAHLNALASQSNDLSTTTSGIEEKLTCWKEGHEMRETYENIQNFEPLDNSEHKRVPDKRVDKVEYDEVSTKKKKSNWIYAGENANNHGTDQETSNPRNHSTVHDSGNSNARSESKVAASNSVVDVAGPSTQICGVAKVEKICNELEEHANQLRREISYIKQTIDFYSRESLKTRRENKALLEELRALYSPEEFAVILAQNPDQEPPSESDDEGGHDF